MRSLILAGITVLVIAPKAYASRLIGLSVTPEVWYAKWQPDVKPKGDNEGLSYTKYGVSPSVLYGVTLTAEYKDFGVAGSYLVSKAERDIGARAGMGKSVSIGSELRGLVQCRLGDNWQMKNRILRGKFSGDAAGVEWDRTTGGVGTRKVLPVNTGWFQGEMLFLNNGTYWHKDLEKVIGAGLVVGYRFQQYSLPVQVQTIAPNGDNYGIPGLSRVSFLDTEFSIHHLILGLERLSDTRTGWNLDVQRLLVGVGVAFAQNSRGNINSRNSKDDNGDANRGLGSFSYEADIGAGYASSVIKFELGYRVRSAQNYLGKGYVGAANGDRIRMKESFWGPYTSMTVRFGAI